MPFCNQCGNQVGERDVFCRACGGRQPVAPSQPRPGPGQGPWPPPGADPLAGLSPRTASVLCYIPAVGWIAAIIVLASMRFRADRTVRFHAFQGLYLFVAWLMNAWVVRPLSDVAWHFHVFPLLELALVGMSIFMMIKAAHDQAYALPLFGELAQRSVAEG